MDYCGSGISNLWCAILLLYGREETRTWLPQRLKKAEKFYDDYNKQRPGAIDAFAKLDPRGALTSKYIIKDGNYPVSRNSDVEYYKQGEEIVASMMEELKRLRDLFSWSTSPLNRDRYGFLFLKS